MQLYAKWFWGFSPETGPYVGFSDPGSRDRLIQTLSHDDRLVYIAASRGEVLEQERGMVLGMVEVEKTPINSVDAISNIDFLPKEHFSNGEYKWPFGVPVKRAWRFKPIFGWKDVMTESWMRNRSAAIKNAVKLTADEQNAILERDVEEINLGHTSFIKSKLEQKSQQRDIIKNLQSDKDWQQFISRTTDRILYRVKTNNGQIVERILKDKNTNMKAPDFEIEIRRLLDDQKERCIITGKKLILGNKWLQPSVDRIDSSKGYIKGNLQITTWAANMAKSDLAQEELEDYFKALQFSGK